MSKKQVIIVGKDVPETIIAQAKAEYPDHEVIVVEDLEEWKKQQKPFRPSPIPFTREKLEDLAMPYVPMLRDDLNKNNPWPSPHHSSKRNKKY